MAGAALSCGVALAGVVKRVRRDSVVAGVTLNSPAGSDRVAESCCPVGRESMGWPAGLCWPAGSKLSDRVAMGGDLS